jgi:hypothetical protein
MFAFLTREGGAFKPWIRAVSHSEGLRMSIL